MIVAWVVKSVSFIIKAKTASFLWLKLLIKICLALIRKRCCSSIFWIIGLVTCCLGGRRTYSWRRLPTFDGLGNDGGKEYDGLPYWDREELNSDLKRQNKKELTVEATYLWHELLVFDSLGNNGGKEIMLSPECRDLPWHRKELISSSKQKSLPFFAALLT